MELFNNFIFYRYNPHMISVSYKYLRKRKKGGLLNVGVVGCGGGGLMHISHFLWHKETIVSTVYDIEKNRFSDIKSRFPFAHKDIKQTTNFEDILKDKSIDIVSIASPDHTHAEYAIAALESGKHVLCEKPMCTSIKDGKKILEATKNTNKVFAVFQQMRFVPRNSKIKAMIDNDQLGSIYFISTGYIHDMRERALEFSEWRKDPINFQHPLFGGIHHIDLLRWLAGEIVEVNTIASHIGLPEYPADDTYLIQLKLKNGGIGNILTCFSPRVTREYHPLRIYGTKGAVHGSEVFLENMNQIESLNLKDSDYKGTPQFRDQISAFIDSINGKSNNIVSAEDAIKTVAVCCAAIESWRSGKSVSVEEIG